jgi:hypothetical protein
MESVLEQRVNERSYGRILSQQDQGSKQKKSYYNGEEPPSLVPPEESQQFGYHADVKGGLTEKPHSGAMA